MPRKITSGVVGGPILGTLSTGSNTFASRESNTNIILAPNGTGVTEFTKDLYTSGNAGIRLGDSDTNYALLKAPAALTGNYTLTLPTDDGAANNVLVTDGSGVLSWTSNALTVTNRTAADNGTYYITMSDGTTGTEDTLSVADGSRLNFVPNPVVTGRAGFGGQVTAVSIVETSSITLKENINPIENALASILSLRGVTYDRLDNNEHESGLIAEWTEEVLPELVTRDTNNDVVGIKYTKLTAYLIEAIKSLKLEIDELKNK